MRRRLHTPFSIAALVAAMVVQFGLAVSGIPLHLPLHQQADAARPAMAADPSMVTVDAATAEGLSADFGRIGYQLDAVAGGGSVPRVVVGAVPADLSDMDGTDARKDVFLRLMLPLVLVADEEVAADRRRLEAIGRAMRTGSPPGPHQIAWLADLARRYDVDPGPRLVERLLERVDAVPPSLALAQAALETGWGTSRQARRGNNLFGQTLVDDGGALGQASFPNLLDAVRAYVHNLNTHRAYRAFRHARAGMRGTGTAPDGLVLAATLTAYSELGHSYVDDVRSVIRSNGLDRLDAARLSGAGEAVRAVQGI